MQSVEFALATIGKHFAHVAVTGDNDKSLSLHIIEYIIRCNHILAPLSLCGPGGNVFGQSDIFPGNAQRLPGCHLLRAERQQGEKEQADAHTQSQGDATEAQPAYKNRELLICPLNLLYHSH